MDGGGISSAGTMIVFGCGRKYCVLSLSEASVPAEPVSVVHDHAVALALLVQQRAAG